VAAFHDLAIADVQLQEEEWDQLNFLFHRRDVDIDVTKTKSNRETVSFGPQVYNALSILWKKKMSQIEDDIPGRIKRAICTLNPQIGKLSHEDLEMIQEHFEAIQKLAAEKKLSNWREMESNFLPLATIPRLLPRVRLMLVMDSWRENAAIMSRNVKNILGACEELKSSEALRHLMALTAVIYNRVMWNERLDDKSLGKCFDIKSLNQLKSTKAQQGNSPKAKDLSMLHFILRLMRKQCPERTLDQVKEQFKYLELVKNVDLAGLRHIRRKLQGDLSLVTSELENHREEYEQIWPEVDDAMAYDSGSDETCSPERRRQGVQPQRSCLARLELMKRQLEVQVDKCLLETQSAEKEGADLLTYFGHEATGEDKLPDELRKFFETFHLFLNNDFYSCWKDLDKQSFKNAVDPKRPEASPRASPGRTPRTPRSRTSTNESTGR